MWSCNLARLNDKVNKMVNINKWNIFQKCFITLLASSACTSQTKFSISMCLINLVYVIRLWCKLSCRVGCKTCAICLCRVSHGATTNTTHHLCSFVFSTSTPTTQLPCRPGHPFGTWAPYGGPLPTSVLLRAASPCPIFR